MSIEKLGNNKGPKESSSPTDPKKGSGGGVIGHAVHSIAHGISVVTGHEARQFERDHAHEGLGIIRETEIRPRPPMLTEIGKTPVMIAQSPLYVIHIEIDGHSAEFPVPKDVFEKFSVGEAVNITYAKQRNPTGIKVISIDHS
ncbi:MAG TPA: hypothetical protein VMU13_01050 [Candidatus Paceibacterota bacterium]|nr:hypothetical protein [Candidatus Paceibacterota bacterium]